MCERCIAIKAHVKQAKEESYKEYKNAIKEISKIEEQALKECED